MMAGRGYSARKDVTGERMPNNNTDLSIDCKMRMTKKKKGSPKASYNKLLLRRRDCTVQIES